jgi:hypothetical protein
MAPSIAAGPTAATADPLRLSRASPVLPPLDGRDVSGLAVVCAPSAALPARRMLLELGGSGGRRGSDGARAQRLLPDDPRDAPRELLPPLVPYAHVPEFTS